MFLFISHALHLIRVIKLEKTSNYVCILFQENEEQTVKIETGQFQQRLFCLSGKRVFSKRVSASLF